MELYKQYRPNTFDELYGQPETVKILKKMVEEDKVPRAMLFSGPSGSGKTTVARILRNELDCRHEDFHEVNAANCRGIDDIREINSQMRYHPFGKCKVWLIDECHALTKDAQTAFLKMLEDTPKTVYFMLATTDPVKLLPTIRTRCTDIKLALLSAKDMRSLLDYVIGKENATLDSDVVDQIIEVAEGSARKALVMLEKVLQLDEEDEQLACIQAGDSKAQMAELCLAMIKGAKFKELIAIAKRIEEEPETTRRGILGYLNAVMSKNPSERLYHCMKAFECNYFDSGKAGLTISLWEAVGK